MKTYQLILLCIFSVLLFSCQESELTLVTNVQDYQKYLDTDNADAKAVASSNLKFWKDKYEHQPSQYPYLSKIAAANTTLFQTTGEVEYLVLAEKYLLQEIEKQPTAANLRTLAKN